MTEDQENRIKTAHQAIADLWQAANDASEKYSTNGTCKTADDAMKIRVARSAVHVAEQRLKNLIRQIAKEDQQ